MSPWRSHGHTDELVGDNGKKKQALFPGILTEEILLNHQEIVIKNLSELAVFFPPSRGEHSRQSPPTPVPTQLLRSFES